MFVLLIARFTNKYGGRRQQVTQQAGRVAWGSVHVELGVRKSSVGDEEASPHPPTLSTFCHYFLLPKILEQHQVNGSKTKHFPSNPASGVLTKLSIYLHRILFPLRNVVVLLGREFGGSKFSQNLFSQFICLFNPDATDELRNFVESSIEAVARNVSRIFENNLLSIFIFMPLSVVRNDLETCIHTTTTQYCRVNLKKTVLFIQIQIIPLWF